MRGLERAGSFKIRGAVRYLALAVRLVVEPSGAVRVAALLARTVDAPAGARVGVVISGGNIEPSLLAEIVSM